jgi:hypothetical protein
MAEGALLRWVRCRLVAGHGVASGRAATSPYPAGTIHLQAPFFAARGIDLAPFFAGTLNLEAPRGHWCLSDPDAQVEALEWTDRHPPETFSFWHCRLRVAAEPAATAIADVDPPCLAALVYYPHPETKQAHHQAPSCLEVLAPWIAGLKPGQELELGVDPRRCRLIDPVRLAFMASQAPGDLDPKPLRAFLRSLWPEALDLDDTDLLATLEQARRLYVN